MNDVKTVKIIPSKSDAHRAYICAALAEYCNEPLKVGTRVICEESSEDIEATRDCLEALARTGNERTGVDLYCRESGSTFRFLLPVVGALGKRGIFHPVGRLAQRPLSPLREELCAHGMRISTPGSIPLIAEGELQGGDFVIDGDISSQFVSGLLFALPLLKEDSRIIVKKELQSMGYVDMTARTITKFGIKMSCEEKDGDTICSIPGGQKYIPVDEYLVEGDWSNGAVWLAAGILGDSPIKVEGLSMDSAQGDRKIVEIIREFGGEIQVEDTDAVESITAYPAIMENGNCKQTLKGITYSAGQTPDLVPMLALIATQAKGTTMITNAQRLRSKESDRLHSVTTTLKTLGADVEELPEGLLIRGMGCSKEALVDGKYKPLKGGAVESFNDHRVVMMAAIASILCREPVQIYGWESVRKSYPTFFDRLEDLGLADNIELL